MRLLAMIAASLTLSCCSPATQAYQPKDKRVHPHPWARRVVLLKHGGCACPVSPLLAYTAQHVVEAAEEGPLAWVQGGLDVPLTVVWQDAKADLALVRSESPFPDWSHRAVAAPRVGDVITILGRGSMVLRRDDVTATVGRVLGLDEDGYLAADAMSFPGTSGGCVLDVGGQLLAVQSAMRWWSERPVRAVALNVPVWQ